MECEKRSPRCVPKEAALGSFFRLSWTDKLNVRAQDGKDEQAVRFTGKEVSKGPLSVLLEMKEEFSKMGLDIESLAITPRGGTSLIYCCALPSAGALEQHVWKVGHGWHYLTNKTNALRHPPCRPQVEGGIELHTAQGSKV